MTLQVIYSVSAGVTQDLSTRVFMASERLGLPPFTITQNAEEGSVAMSQLVVDDPSGDLTMRGHRRVYYVETAAPSGQQVIGNGYVGTKEISRGDWNVGPLARSFNVNLADANTLISRRLIVGSDGNRPAESDVVRVQWLLTTTEANEFNGSSTYVNTVGGVSMDAVDYRGQSVEAILSDCSQASHRNWWIVYFEALGQFGLWYDWDYSTAYSSAIRLSNNPAYIDDSTTFAYFPTATLTQDPSRVYSGTLIDFQPAATETASWVYEQRASTGAAFVYRDVAYPSGNVKTEAKARARAQAYLNESDEEADIIRLSFVVPAAKVNALMHGHRIEVNGTHWGSTYTAFSWMRCLTRTVTQMSSTHYRIDAELSPIPASLCGEGLCQRFNTGYNVTIPECGKVGDMLVAVMTTRGQNGSEVFPAGWTFAGYKEAYNGSQYPGPGDHTAIAVYYHTVAGGDPAVLAVDPNHAGTETFVTVLPGKGGIIPTIYSGTLNTYQGTNISVGPTAGGGVLWAVYGFQRNDANQQSSGFAVNPTGTTQTLSPAGTTFEGDCGVSWADHTHRRWIGAVQGASALTLTGTLASPGGQESVWGTAYVALRFA